MKTGPIGEIINVDRYVLPADAKEGDVLKIVDGRYVVDCEERARIEERINEKLENLFED